MSNHNKLPTRLELSGKTRTVCISGVDTRVYEELKKRANSRQANVSQYVRGILQSLIEGKLKKDDNSE